MAFDAIAIGVCSYPNWIDLDHGVLLGPLNRAPLVLSLVAYGC